MYWVNRDQWKQLEIISATENLAVWFGPTVIVENNLYVAGGKWTADNALRTKVKKQATQTNQISPCSASISLQATCLNLITGEMKILENIVITEMTIWNTVVIATSIVP